MSPRARGAYPTTARTYVEEAARQFAKSKGLFDKKISLLSVSGGRPKLSTSYDSPRRSFQDGSGMPGSWPTEAYSYKGFLGYGASGYVEKVTDNYTGKVYAKKRMETKGQDWVKFRSRVLDEVRYMRKVACVHVVKVDEYQEDEQDAMEIYMTPVADGNLLQILEAWTRAKCPQINTRIIYSWFGCLLAALAFVHSKGVLHKDIKPQNILVKDQIVYLSDFGLSRDFEGGISQTRGPFAGTWEYQAPEFLTNQGHGRPVDVFALGCVFSEMDTAVHGEDLKTFKSLRLVSESRGQTDHSFASNLDRVKTWVGNLRGDEKDNVLVDIILEMLEVVGKKRITSADALNRLGSQKELRCRHGL